MLIGWNVNSLSPVWWMVAVAAGFLGPEGAEAEKQRGRPAAGFHQRDVGQEDDREDPGRGARPLRRARSWKLTVNPLTSAPSRTTSSSSPTSSNDCCPSLGSWRSTRTSRHKIHDPELGRGLRPRQKRMRMTSFRSAGSASSTSRAGPHTHTSPRG